MANLNARAGDHRSAIVLPTAGEHEAIVRALKNRLQRRFPTIGSSHLSEAIAAGFGFNTNAALRAGQSGPHASKLRHGLLDTSAFYRRLLDFEYPLAPDFTMGPAPAQPQPSEQFQSRLTQLKQFERQPNPLWPVIHRLRDACELEFARAFDLGHSQDREDKAVATRWSVGVDHGACLPNWGANVNNQSGALVKFPGSDHVVRFCQALPLSNGKFVEYESAQVSMPYVGRHDLPSQFPDAAQLAGRLGWTASAHAAWSWYMHGSTTLILFKRSTPHAAMLKAWDGSFKRWLMENRTTLGKRAGDTRRKVIADIINCQHLPLDLVDFEDCRERYLKEFAPDLYHEPATGMALVFKRLMAIWQQER